MVDRAWVLSRFYRVAYHLARVYWFVARPKKRGVKCAITRAEEILLVRHTYGDRRSWDLPGGSIKRGEDPLGDFFARYEHRDDTMYCFHAAVEDANPVPDRVEIAEARWFPTAALPAHTGRFVRRILSMSEAAAARRMTPTGRP
jgi:8-oxo-dGTP pyrophosphatase MutT (NUDIX family)